MPKRETPPRKSAARPRRSATRHVSTTPPSHEDVARRAYEIYLARDGAPGDQTSDWLRAEAELVAAS